MGRLIMRCLTVQHGFTMTTAISRMQYLRSVCVGTGKSPGMPYLGIDAMLNQWDKSALQCIWAALQLSRLG